MVQSCVCVFSRVSGSRALSRKRGSCITLYWVAIKELNSSYHIWIFPEIAWATRDVWIGGMLRGLLRGFASGFASGIASGFASGFVSGFVSSYVGKQI